MYITASARGGWHALGTRLGLSFSMVQSPVFQRHPHIGHAHPKVHPVLDLNLPSDGRDLERLISAVRLLATRVFHPVLNPATGDFFPASYSPRIKRLDSFSAGNRILVSVLCSTPPQGSGSCSSGSCC